MEENLLFPQQRVTTYHNVFGYHLHCVFSWAWSLATWTENMAKIQIHDKEPMIENKYLVISMYSLLIFFLIYDA